MRLLYFSPVRAGSYAQRPHFMVRAWLDWGAESVLWVNPYPCRLPRWQDLRRKNSLNEQGTPLDSRIRVLNVPALPIEPLPLGSWLNDRLLGRNAWREIEDFASGQTNLPIVSGGADTSIAFGGADTSIAFGGADTSIAFCGADIPVCRKKHDLIIGIGRPCALALTAIRRLRPAVSFFDAMDNFPEFHRGLSRRAMRFYEDAVAAEVDLVVASSTFLAEKFAHRGLRVEKVLNGYEGIDTPLARSPSLPSPVLGYLGCIGRWFDWPLVIRLAEAMPQATIELVGPCVVPPPCRLPANVRLLPACKLSETAGHLARFSAGLIPFRNDALTAGVDPLKYYDYRAAGMPVLSTRFGEMALRGRDDGVYFLDDACDLAEVVSAALGHPRNAAEMARFHHDNTWTFRFSQSNGLRSLLPASRIRRAA